jgi:branched-chain amino acid transport system substrate-binding protein
MNILKHAAVAAVFAMFCSSVSWANTIKVGVSGSFAVYGKQHLETVQARVAKHQGLAGEPAIEFLFKHIGLPNRSVAKTLAQEALLLVEVSDLAGFTFTPNAIAWHHRSTSRNPQLPSSMPPPRLSPRQPRNLPAAQSL